MAMTKKMRVSFDLTLVIDSELEAKMLAGAVEASKRFMSGVDGDIGADRLAFLEAITEKGPDAALEMQLRSGIRGLVKETFIKEAEFTKASPANVHFIK